MSKKRLLNQFKVGFELEGFLDYQVNPDTCVTDLAKRFDELIGKQGDMHRDGSLHARRGSCAAFEYSTAPIEFTPKNMQKVMKWLESLPSLGVFTNTTCSLHTHISYNGINQNDLAWSLFYMILEEKIDNFLYFWKDKRTKFSNKRYATTYFIERIRGNAWHDGNLDNLLQTLFSNEKYRAFRLHPQGTLEWRGPRTFLNRPSKKKTVAYFQELRDLLKTINESFDVDVVENHFADTTFPGKVPHFYERKDFDEAAERHKRNFSFKDDNGTCKGRIEKLCDRLVANPLSFKRIPEKVMLSLINPVREELCNSHYLCDIIADAKCYKLDRMCELTFFRQLGRLKNVIKKIDPTFVLDHLKEIEEDDDNNLSSIFNYLISYDDVNVPLLKALTKLAIKYFGQSPVQNFTYNAMYEIVYYNLNAFKYAATVDIEATYGWRKAWDLVKKLVAEHEHTILKSDIYKKMLAGPNSSLIKDATSHLGGQDSSSSFAKIVSETLN